MSTQSRKLNEAELGGLEPEALFRYLLRMRRAGEAREAQLALQILVFRSEPLVRAKVAAKVPVADVDEVVGRVFDSALRAAFDGEEVRSFRAWLIVIARRRIADYHGASRLPIEPLAGEHEGDDELFGADPSVGDETGAVAVRDALRRSLARLGDLHLEVVELALLEGLSARETCAVVNAAEPPPDPPMSEANVDKIKSRFRADLRRELGEDD